MSFVDDRFFFKKDLDDELGSNMDKDITTTRNDMIFGVVVVISLGAIFKYKYWCGKTKSLCKKCKRLLHTAFSTYSSKKKTYMWSTMKYAPGRYPWSRTILDKVFMVDPLWTRLNSGSKKSDSVFINRAMLSTQTFCVDVTDQIEDLKGDLDDPFMGENGQISIGISDILNLDADLIGTWNLDVTYTGHANSSKKLEARQFAVRYQSKGEEEVLFPPYSVSEKTDKGLNIVRVLSAVDVDGRDRSLDAKMYAGLKATFYEDLSDEVMKNYLPGKQTIVTLSRGERVVVKP